MKYRAEEAEEGMRLDLFIAARAALTRSRAANLIDDGAVRVDGKSVTKCGFALKTDMEIDLTLPELKPSPIEAEELPLRIVYQDADLAVVYKPSGMVVHPAAGNWSGTLVSALLYHLDGLSGIGGEARPGIVHRIDKDTSGLLLVAKNDASHLALSEQIQAHTVKRGYLAIVQGSMKEESGTVNAPIGRHPADRKKMAIVKTGGREAITNWRVLERLRGATLVECRLETGRTHQIRVHMASLNHPLLGDPVYGPKKPPFPVEGGQLLHAFRLGFTHPVSGEQLLFEAEPEPRFTAWLERLRK